MVLADWGINGWIELFQPLAGLGIIVIVAAAGYKWLNEEKGFKEGTSACLAIVAAVAIWLFATGGPITPPQWYGQSRAEHDAEKKRESVRPTPEPDY